MQGLHSGPGRTILQEDSRTIVQGKYFCRKQDTVAATTSLYTAESNTSRPDDEQSRDSGIYWEFGFGFCLISKVELTDQAEERGAALKAPAGSS
eukprot:1616655-Rhodomonas_salina.1